MACFGRKCRIQQVRHSFRGVGNSLEMYPFFHARLHKKFTQEMRFNIHKCQSCLHVRWDILRTSSASAFSSCMLFVRCLHHLGKPRRENPRPSPVATYLSLTLVRTTFPTLLIRGEEEAVSLWSDFFFHILRRRIERPKSTEKKESPEETCRIRCLNKAWRKDSPSIHQSWTNNCWTKRKQALRWTSGMPKWIDWLTSLSPQCGESSFFFVTSDDTRSGQKRPGDCLTRGSGGTTKLNVWQT